jgi:hypothetical protein
MLPIDFNEFRIPLRTLGEKSGNATPAAKAHAISLDSLLSDHGDFGNINSTTESRINLFDDKFSRKQSSVIFKGNDILETDYESYRCSYQELFVPS